MMNAEIRLAWAHALLSGAYTQGTNYLKRNTGEGLTPNYCCLGVLCDLAEAEGVVEWKEGHTADDDGHEVTVLRGYFTEGLTFGVNGELPDSVREWAGLDRHNPVVEYNGAKETLATLNDQNGLSFSEIAGLIEQL